MSKRPQHERCFTLQDLALAYHQGCDDAAERIGTFTIGKTFETRQQTLEKFLRKKAEQYEIEYPPSVVPSSGGEEG